MRVVARVYFRSEKYCKFEYVKSLNSSNSIQTLCYNNYNKYNIIIIIIITINNNNNILGRSTGRRHRTPSCQLHLSVYRFIARPVAAIVLTQTSRTCLVYQYRASHALHYYTDVARRKVHAVVELIIIIIIITVINTNASVSAGRKSSRRWNAYRIRSQAV